MTGKKLGFFQKATEVGEEIVNNFTQAQTIRNIKNKSGSPDYPNYNCPQRKDLDEKLTKLGPDHAKSIGDINQGHDMVKTPLDPKAKKALLNQAKYNEKNGLSPFQPHANTRNLEVHNSHALFFAAKKSNSSKDLAGGIIHFGKSIIDGVSQEMLPSDEFKVTFGNK